MNDTGRELLVQIIDSQDFDRHLSDMVEATCHALLDLNGHNRGEVDADRAITTLAELEVRLRVFAEMFGQEKFDAAVAEALAKLGAGSVKSAEAARHPE